MDFGQLTGFANGGSGGFDGSIGPRAMAARRDLAMQGGQDQSGFSDPTGAFFNLILQQLNAPPPMTPGGTKRLPIDYSLGVDPGHPWSSGKIPGRTVVSSRVKAIPQTDFLFNWNAQFKTNDARMGSKYGTTANFADAKTQYIQGMPGLKPTGELGATPDYSNLINLADQVWGTKQGDFTSVLANLQKGIGNAQSIAGTFNSQAGAAAGGAAGAAYMDQLKAYLAPKLIEASQLQNFNYEPTLNGNPTGGPLVAGPNQQRETILEYQRRMNAAK